MQRKLPHRPGLRLRKQRYRVAVAMKVGGRAGWEIVAVTKGPGLPYDKAAVRANSCKQLKAVLISSDDPACRRTSK
jgi:hypothetical protein